MQGLTAGLEGFVLFAVREWHSQVLHFKCSLAFVHISTFPMFSSLVPSCALEGILFTCGFGFYFCGFNFFLNFNLLCFL